MHWGEDGTWWRWNTLIPPSQTKLESRTLRAANKQLAAEKQPKAENFQLRPSQSYITHWKTRHFIRGNIMCDFIRNLFQFLRPRPCWEEGNCIPSSVVPPCRWHEIYGAQSQVLSKIHKFNDCQSPTIMPGQQCIHTNNIVADFQWRSDEVVNMTLNCVRFSKMPTVRYHVIKRPLLCWIYDKRRFNVTHHNVISRPSQTLTFHACMFVSTCWSCVAFFISIVISLLR